MLHLLSRPAGVLWYPGRARRAVALIFFLHGFLFANWAARLPELELRYGLSHRELGQVLFCSAIGAWCAMPLAGWLSQRLGSGRLTTLGALLFCGLIPGMALLGSTGQVMLLFLLLGAATGLLDVAMNAQAIQVEQLKGKPIMSSFHAAFSLGGMLGAGAGALGARLGMDFGTNLLVLSGLGVLATVGAGLNLLPVEPTEASPANQAKPPVFRWPSRALLGLGLVAFCCMLGEGAMADWSTIYLVQETGASTSLAPLGYAAFSLAMTGGRVFGDALVARFGAHRVVVLGGVLACSGLLGSLLLPQTAVGIGGLLLVGLGLSAIVPVVFSAAGQQSGLAPAAAIGTVSTIGYGGLLLGPPLVGWLADGIGLRGALGLVALLFAVLAGIAQNLRLPAPGKSGL
jgi:MFS family permease